MTQNPLATMAIAYDFDGTLASGNMQEHHFLPELGIAPDDFWKEVKAIAKEQQADEILVSMMLMLEKAKKAGISITRSDFEEHGKNIQFFPGLPEWFPRLTAYAQEHNIRLLHYIVSSGNEEIIAGSAIAPHVEKIYASKFVFDAQNQAVWPALAINYTTKTQYLFRINKGAHDLSDNTTINRKFVDHEKRPVPFDYMVFIGDGMTDIPSFRLIKKEGGLSIAVTLSDAEHIAQAQSYIVDGRVDCVVPACYEQDSPLENILKTYIRLTAEKARLRALFEKAPHTLIQLIPSQREAGISKHENESIALS